VCAARVGKRVAATVEVGARGPLITAVGGVAILVALPKEEAGPIIGENLRQLTRFGETRIRALRTVLRHSEAKGFGLSQGIIVPGVGACGVPIRDKKGVPFASINVVGPLERFTTAAIPQLVLQLQEQASALEREAARVFKPKRP
jgi:DNA-binding IclR family transcriptional regulator